MVATIHQTLHGYSDGHRLISGSLPLTSSDARLMVVMSDLSGPGVKPDPAGYITGYSLEGAGKYVLARTWAAPEMPRPGCVWTHSLIIDNADLATLASAEGLLPVFRRPDALRSKAEYAEPIPMPGALLRPLRAPEARVRGLVDALYAAPDRTVVAEAEDAEEDERLVTAIWMQQWPRLRRSFGFCTLSGMDRSGKGATLHLQLVSSSDRQHRTRFPNAVTPSEVTHEPALEALVADLEGRDATKVRDFLRRTGGDVDGGRRAMLPLCRLHSSLFSGEHPDLSAAVEALAGLDALGTRQARSVRMLIARTALEEVEQVDDGILDFIVETLELSVRPNEKPLSAWRIGGALWRRSPVRFFEAVDAGGVVGDASAASLRTISAPELVQGLRDNAALAERVVEVRPELLESAELWSISDVDEGLASDVDADSAGRVAAALLSAGRTGPASLIVERSRADELASVLDASADAPVLAVWLRALIGDAGKAAAVLASGGISRRSVVLGLAQAGGADDVPNDYGEDPWLIAIRSAPKVLDQEEEDFLAAFLMARALGFRSRSQAELIRFAYTTLYRAFQQDRLRGDAASIATWRLEWGIWSGWDNCSRLRETVVDRFIDGHLDPETFGRLTDDGDLAMSLIDEASKTRRGRRYLNEVRKSLKNAQEKEIKVRADYIAGKMK